MFFIVGRPSCLVSDVFVGWSFPQGKCLFLTGSLSGSLLMVLGLSVGERFVKVAGGDGTPRVTKGLGETLNKRDPKVRTEERSNGLALFFFFFPF